MPHVIYEVVEKHSITVRNPEIYSVPLVVLERTIVYAILISARFIYN